MLINQKKAGEAVLISDNTKFRTRKVIRDKEKEYTIPKCPFSKKT